MVWGTKHIQSLAAGVDKIEFWIHRMAWETKHHQIYTAGYAAGVDKIESRTARIPNESEQIQYFTAGMD